MPVLLLLFAQMVSVTNRGIEQLNNKLTIEWVKSASDSSTHFNASRAFSVASEHLTGTLQLSFVALSSDLGLMLGLGASFVLLGAMLRNRAGARMSRRARTAKRSIAIPTELS
jgi:hypothetical protein